MSTVGKFHQALAHLLPTGWAWPRDPDSVLMCVLRGMAGAFGELHDYTDATAADWQPHRTVRRMAEWEEAVGLPDTCGAAEQTEEARRAVLLARLRGPTLAYSDSSPAAPGAIEAVCAALGYTATVHYNLPFRVGRNRCGQRLGHLDGRLYVTVTAEAPSAVSHAALECCLARIVPARYEPVVIYP